MKEGEDFRRNTDKFRKKSIVEMDKEHERAWEIYKLLIQNKDWFDPKKCKELWVDLTAEDHEQKWTTGETIAHAAYMMADYFEWAANFAEEANN